MDIIVFSSEGCIRCKIVKDYLRENRLDFTEYDITTYAGNEAFKQFYRENRKRIRRDANGVFFPLVLQGEHLVQDAGPVLSWFVAGDKLNGMITPNNLGHGWTGGLHVSAGAPGCFEPFVTVLWLLKKGGLKTEVDTWGKNAALLRTILEKDLVDRLSFHVRCEDDGGPEARESMLLAKNAMGRVDVLFHTEIAAAGGCVSPTAVEAAARLLNEATGDNRLPYVIRPSGQGSAEINLLPFRTAARRWQVLADVERGTE